jgi:hypothetical protein
VEALAAKAREKRQLDCSEAVNKLLAEMNCEVRVVCQIGGAVVLLDSIFSAPLALNIVAKEVTL